MSASVVLKSLHSPLEDTKIGATPLVLGRNEQTKIEDKRCSKEQIKLWLDEGENELVVQHVGSNSSCVIQDSKESVLKKHAVKRLPLPSLPMQDKEFFANTRFCTICLLSSPEQQYCYDVHIIRGADPPQGSPAKLDVKATSQPINATPLNGTAPQCVEQAKTRRKFNESEIVEVIKSKKPKGDLSEYVASNSDWMKPEDRVFLFNSPGLEARTKIAAFDMDGTLIVPASGAKWPKSKDDWKFIWPSIPTKLNNLHKEGFKLVIFTNQAGIAKGIVKATDIQHKIESIGKQLDAPIQAMIAASKKGLFRKPAPGMWDYLVRNGNNGVEVDRLASVYVGDAAGRPANWAPSKKKDFASSDRLFALNIGVPFQTPEAFFDGSKEAPYVMPEFDPAKALLVSSLLEPAASIAVSPRQEVIIMVGFPGSGKSFFCNEHLPSYEHVNRDTLGSWQKCVARCEKALLSGKSVVIDNTNPDRESRARYIACAMKYKAPVRCFLMNTSYKHSRHNELYRQLTDSTHAPINDMIMHAYKDKYEEPAEDEGFLSIVRVNLLPKFKDDEQKKLYSYHLLEN